MLLTERWLLSHTPLLAGMYGHVTRARNPNIRESSPQIALVYSDPRSDRTFFGTPKGAMTCRMRMHATVTASWLGTATAIKNREKQSIMVRMNLFPWAVGKGPIASMDMVSQGPLALMWPSGH